MKQMGLTMPFIVKKAKVTRQQLFLSQMDKAIPWQRLEKQIEPFYYPSNSRSRVGRPCQPLSVMLRLYFIRQWFNLSDSGVEDKMYDVPSMCAFAGIDRSVMDIPDAPTILRFRHRLEKHGLCKAMFNSVNQLLISSGYLLQTGTNVDAALIGAPTSTKSNTHNPEMHQTKKGKQ